MNEFLPAISASKFDAVRVTEPAVAAATRPRSTQSFIMTMDLRESARGRRQGQGEGLILF